MRPTLLQQAQYGLQSDGTRGVQQFRPKVPYDTYKSKYGPNYEVSRHVSGVSYRGALRYARFLGAFGMAAGIFVVFFFNGVPRVQRDIIQKIPVVGDFYHHDVAPEDNPF